MITAPELIAAILGSSVVTAFVAKILGKRKENVEIEHQWKETRDLDVKFSEEFQKLIDEKVKARTQDLRDTIVENDLAHYKAIKSQGEAWTEKYVSLEEQAERRIRVLEMKMQLMEERFEKQIKFLEKSLEQERQDCATKLTELQNQLNNKQ